jgi:phage gp29-like protein
MQLWPEYLRWLLQCAIPSLVGYTAPEGEIKTYLKNSDGELIRDSDGNPIYEVGVTSLLNSLVQLRNASAIALPNGAKVEPISNTVSGDPFKGMRDVLNEEIEMGLLLQTLATSEGRHMSRAASESHLSILDLFVVFIKELLIDVIRRDILKPLFSLNFQNFDFDLLPKVSLGDVERRDWSKDVTAIATLWKSGFIGESQKVGYDKIISAPDRDVESDKIDTETQVQKEQEAKASIQNSTPKPSNTKASKEDLLEKIKLSINAYEQLYGEIE